MKFGVPLVPLVALLLPGFLSGMWLSTMVNWRFAPVIFGSLAVAYIWMRIVTSRDDQRLTQMVLKLKLAVTAARRDTNVLAVFTRGNTAAAVRASSATPGQFAPVRIRGVEYHDGDEAEPVPIRAARALGAEVVIAVDVSAYLEKTPAEAPEAWRVRDRRRSALIELERPFADVFIHPDLNYYAGISEAYRRMCIQRGADAARAAIPKIRELLQQSPRLSKP